MQVQRKHLQELLGLCRKAVDPKSANVLGSDLFIFRDGCVYAYNDLSYARIPLQGSTEELPEFCVRAEDLLQVLQNYSEETLEFQVGKNTLGVLAGKRSKTELALLETDLYARILAVAPPEGDSWEGVLSAELLEALQYCFLGDTGSRVSGIFIDSSWIIASDNVTMNYVAVEKGFQKPVWLSDKSFKDILGFCEKEEVEYRYHDGWLFLRNSRGESLGFRNLRVENYPRESYLKFLQQCQDSTVLLSGEFPGDLREVLRRVKLFSTKYTKRNEARIRFCSSGIIFSAENEKGRTSDLLELEGSFSEDLRASITLEGLEHLLAFSSSFHIVPTALSKGRSGFAMLFHGGPWTGITLMPSLD